MADPALGPGTAVAKVLAVLPAYWETEDIPLAVTEGQREMKEGQRTWLPLGLVREGLLWFYEADAPSQPVCRLWLWRLLLLGFNLGLCLLQPVQAGWL